MQAGGQLGAWLDDDHAVLSHDSRLFVCLCCRHFPTAGFGGGGCLKYGGLHIVWQAAEGAFVHNDNVLGHPRVDRGVVGDEVPSGRVRTRGRRGDHCFDLTCCKGLRDVRRLDLNRGSTCQCREFLQCCVVGTEPQTSEVFDGCDFTIGIKTLRRPRHRKERHQALFGQKFRHNRLLCFPETGGVIVACRNKWLAVDPEGCVIVNELRQEEFTDRHLTRADDIADFAMREQRSAGMNRDF